MRTNKSCDLDKEFVFNGFLKRTKSQQLCLEEVMLVLIFTFIKIKVMKTG